MITVLLSAPRVVVVLASFVIEALTLTVFVFKLAAGNEVTSVCLICVPEAICAIGATVAVLTELPIIRNTYWAWYQNWLPELGVPEAFFI